ncbi:hypothetical protein SASPL_145896 [Salvia splendens]|uniref:Uncharacterized protein n=1 Tax=Salvia splendens TaxID=180675 RepID=A0A8X8WII9_SALSN|nr:hypothetical protein SASPL_145896 [Salvia splendens]
MTALEESSMRESLTSGKPHSRKRQKSSRSSPNSDSSTPVAESVDVNCLSASRILLTKDLRHKRVFSPAVNSELEEENEEQSKLLKGFVSSVAAPDFDGKEYKIGKSRFAWSEVGDERIDGANDLKLKDQTIPGNEPLPKMKMAPNGCWRKKVFKTPNSFSYRRLLLHLMDIVNNTSSVTKFELVDAGSLSKLRELDGVSFEPRSIAENSCAVETECVAPNLQKPLDCWILDVNENGHQNDMNGVDDASVQENIQTTPPDPGIIAKTEVSHGRESEDAKTNQTSIGLPVCSEKGSSATSKQCPHTKCAAKLMNKMFAFIQALNPCSRLRLFGNLRSISYRRLLPFLMDISKADSYGSSSHSNSNLVSSIPELSATNYSSNIDLRAFEFSRNQLQDAEEVASQLMKELANVRLLLEKSIIDKDDSASIRPCSVLIKEACDRAIEAETLAKAHLGELNNDLSVHCRIPDLLQPKVSFAHSNQYKKI